MKSVIISFAQNCVTRDILTFSIDRKLLECIGAILFWSTFAVSFSEIKTQLILGERVIKKRLREKEKQLFS